MTVLSEKLKACEAGKAAEVFSGGSEKEKR